uniref:Integrase catalytic domain-containing protein n=1 Tax=Amphimedon queenslandica TaxID=400682 RepID=A0A1X7V2P5_AMPQE
MDVDGPVPKTSRGNLFSLVINNYTSRYAEAIVLRTVTAKNVAEVLIYLFPRYRMPEEIETNQESNFALSLLELYQLIGIKAIRTTTYYCQTNGLMEKFNCTPKSMPQRVLSGKKQYYDFMLP